MNGSGDGADAEGGRAAPTALRFSVSARTGEFWVCAALAALALYAGVTSAGMPMGSYNLPGPGVFPLVLSVLLGIGAVARIAWLLAHRGEGHETVALGHPNIAVALVALAGVAFGIERAGFVLTMVVFLALLFRVLGHRPWWYVVLVAIASVAGLWYFFDQLIGVVLPSGDLLPWS